MIYLFAQKIDFFNINTLLLIIYTNHLMLTQGPTKIMSSIIKNGIILDKEDIITLKNTNTNTEYYCFENLMCKNFTLLHKLVLLNRSSITNKYPKLNIIIKEHITSSPEELNKVNEKGFTALHLASKNSNCWSSIETVKLLLSFPKCNINAKTDNGMTALMYAVSHCNNGSSIETVKLLLDYDADINAKCNNGETALILASKYSNRYSSIEAIKLLLVTSAQNIEINAKSNTGMTALMYTSNPSDSSYQQAYASLHSNDCSNIETVKLLLENNANVNAKNDRGWTALSYVSQYFNELTCINTAKLLLEYDVIPNSKFPNFVNDIKLLNTLS